MRGQLALLLCLAGVAMGKLKKLQVTRGQKPKSWKQDADKAIRDGKEDAIKAVFEPRMEEIDSDLINRMTPLQFACKIGSAGAVNA